MRGLRWSLLVACSALAASVHGQTLDDAITEVRLDWEVISYQTPAPEREGRFEALAARVHGLVEANPQRSAPLVWEGHVLAAWAGEKNPFAALGLLQRARRAYEAAIRIDTRALDISALIGLGELYLHAPRWPLAFGDPAKARELLQQALSLDPAGLDSNFCWADYLLATGHADEAVGHLQRALLAPVRPGHRIADTGRREQARQLLGQARTLSAARH